MDHAPKLRIGQLSYRVGVPTELLRAWEKRYGVLKPARSEAGFRLYSEADEWRVRMMQEQLRSGLGAAEAAREVARIERERYLPDASFPTPEELARELGGALEAFDEDVAHAVLDRLFGIYGLERSIQATLMPYLRDLGDRWARGKASVAQEHFASRLIEGRLLALARGWNKGPGRRAVLACPSGEQHTLPLICFGLVLRSRGWRSVYLGGDTPPSTVHMAADTVDADVIVLAAVSNDRFASIVQDLAAIARRRTLLLAGAGATSELTTEVGVESLSDDPVSAAEALSRRFAATGRSVRGRVT